MLKISRTVMIDDKAVTIELTYDKNGLAISKDTKSLENEATMEILEFTLDEADTLYELMKLVRPTHDGGRDY